MKSTCQSIPKRSTLVAWSSFWNWHPRKFHFFQKTCIEIPLEYAVSGFDHWLVCCLLMTLIKAECPLDNLSKIHLLGNIWIRLTPSLLPWFQREREFWVSPHCISSKSLFSYFFYAVNNLTTFSQKAETKIGERKVLIRQFQKRTFHQISSTLVNVN